MRSMPKWTALSARVRTISAEVSYFLREATTSFRRNGLMSVAAVTTLLVTLLTVGAAFLSAVNLAHLAQTLEAQVQVIAFLNERLSASEVARVHRAVAALPGVLTVRFVSRAEALKRLQQRLGGTAAFTDVAEANPLPDSLEVHVADAQRVADIAATISRLRGVAEVSFGGQVVERLTALTRGLRILIGVIVVALTWVALIIMVNTIRLTVIARRTEIEIMELVGATRWFIRWPFLIEGMLHGTVGAVSAASVLAIVYTVVVQRLQESVPFLPTVPPAQAILPLVVVVLTMGVTLGAVGSTFAVRRFLGR